MLTENSSAARFSGIAKTKKISAPGIPSVSRRRRSAVPCGLSPATADFNNEGKRPGTAKSVGAWLADQKIDQLLIVADDV